MKKNLLIILALTLICVIAVGGYIAVDSVFPKAEPINIPTPDSIVSVTLTRNDGVSATEDGIKLEDILNSITAAQPTRKMSVNDYPTAKSYYTLEIHTSAYTYKYFIYEENSKVYIEIPYEGIYKADSKALDLVSTYFQK